MKSLVAVICVTLFYTEASFAAFGGGSDRVRLTDISTLTLSQGKHTTGRRSAPVPQLTCVGGSARSEYAPEVVQCYNRGSDGSDVQWECKADMDNRYKFGRVEVTCEGYEYPDDPYILKGSCGLEYTVDHAPGAYNQQNSNYHNKHQYESQDNSYDGYKKSSKMSNVFGDLITLAIIAVIVYAIYKTCLNNRNTHGTDRMPQPDDHSSRPDNGGHGYGFRPEYTDNSGSCGSSTSYGSTHNTGRPHTGNMGGGFWTGAATGGLLGYLFGNRNNTYTHNPYGYQRPHYRSNSWFSGAPSSGSWFSGRSAGYGGSSGSSFGSTRSTSGFGGTKRR